MLRRSALACGLAAAFVASVGNAQPNYPERPVKIIVPYPAGGYYDHVARVMAETLRTKLKQSFIVENKVGANGIIGVAQVAKAPADGYTLLLAAIGPNAISPVLTPNLNYDPVTDLAPISLLVSAPNVLVVPASSDVKNLDDLIAASRKHSLNYAHNGVGSSTHLAMELLKGATGMQMVGVPYRGSAPAVVAVTSGEVQASFGSVLDVLPQIQAGRLRALGVGSSEHIPAIGQVPTVAEQGVPGFESTAWSGLMAPANTPKSVIETLNRAVNAALKDPAIGKQLSPGGELQILGGSAEHFAAYLKADLKKWEKVVSDNGIKTD
ncbi:MAG: tripartite tricarboxylate transporter substrate binding protein [Pigmentiphaga sp.]|uniref:Bug family tripartite tricarboxylate transporter substrate binding protein n=1 Tax=Pigmentiphaga sp. TaxID=1977564 RepID=UPI0029A8A872|nr:tripartite tricarboxylate transporter substrate binding protein [Pigmentiphaga sp.]MDX3908175.1 tripartite tricarboxylate transporter substrate binding protein [Pigmentiphaga sp.]